MILYQADTKSVGGIVRSAEIVPHDHQGVPESNSAEARGGESPFEDPEQPIEKNDVCDTDAGTK